MSEKAQSPVVSEGLSLVVFVVPYGVVEFETPSFLVHIKPLTLSVTDCMHKLEC